MSDQMRNRAVLASAMGHVAANPELAIADEAKLGSYDFDSLDFSELVIMLETELGIDLGEAQTLLTTDTTVGEIVQLLESFGPNH